MSEYSREQPSSFFNHRLNGWNNPIQISLWTMTAGIILNLSAIALAQLVPQPDRNGDYFSNAAPLQRVNPPSPLQAGSLWQVVSAGLNCRREPGSRQPVVRQYSRGSILEAEVGRGGSDEVLLNAKDTTGKPWMPVRGKSFEEQCYVRANSQYIRPLAKHNN